MSLLDEQNSDEFKYSDWGRFFKLLAVCGVLSMLIAALTMPAETSSEILRMIAYVVFGGILIMILPVLIGLLSGLLKRDQSFSLLVSWVIIAGLFLLGSFA